MRSNFHTHTKYCDGDSKVFELIETAISKGMVSLGFSGHAPLPFRTSWNMSKRGLSRYIQDINAAKEAYRGRIEIYLGLEIDYIEGIQSPADPFYDGLSLDYAIGSVHYARPDHGKKLVTMDGPQRLFDHGLHSGFADDAKALYKRYYKSVRDMVAKGGFNLLGHLDVLKKNNRGSKYYREDEQEYRHEIELTLDAIEAKKDLIMELNTGAIARGKADSPYPSEWILREASRRGIKICVNSDAHTQWQLCAWYDEAFDLLREAGYQSTMTLLGGEWRETPIDK